MNSKNEMSKATIRTMNNSPTVNNLKDMKNSNGKLKEVSKISFNRNY